MKKGFQIGKNSRIPSPRGRARVGVCKKPAFTLAEVLITLGVIGVVAGMTMPTVIANYQKKQTAAKLQKFYTIMSQALLRWETDEGLSPNDVTFTVTKDEEGNLTDLEGDFRTWYDNNLGKYLNSISKSVKTSYVDTSDRDESRYTIALNDGSGFCGYIVSEKKIYIFYCTEFKYCAPESYDGKKTFLFNIENGRFYSGSANYLQTRAQILDKCKNSKKGHCHQCAKLIQQDGWEIKDDYPW